MTNIRKWIRIVEGNDDHKHADALEKTGFWGAQGAGCIFFAKDTGKFMLAYRSNLPPPYNVEQPHTYATFGGAIDAGENPQDAVKREVHEEAGYSGAFDLEPLFVFKSNTFRYYNYVAIVEQQFHAKLDWETESVIWFDFGDWPSPLHFGIKSLLADKPSYAKLEALHLKYNENNK